MNIKVNQVYKIKPNKKRDYREDTLTIVYVEPTNKYFVARESVESWDMQLLLDCYDLAEDDSEYTLTFTEAMQVLYNNEGWIQGENFVKNYVIANDKNRGITLTDFAGVRTNVTLSVGLMRQKYRVVQFQTELEK